MKKSLYSLCLPVILAGIVLITGCPTNPEDEPPPETGTSVDWEDHPSGTLTVSNNTSKDMVVFQGQTPTPSTILGGVRGLATKTFDISLAVSDFEVGGYMILRGMALNEYEANKANLSLAKIEYSAMATYAQGKKFRTEISPNYTGDYSYKVTNSGRIGMELRKNSPDGEKIGYLPSLSTNVMLYSDTTNALAIFPVYVYYTKSTGQITTVRPTSHFDSVTATPRPVNDSSVPTYYFPNDQTVTWDTIKASLVSPMAYFTVSNNVPNQGAYFTIAGGNALLAQNGYDAVGTGEQLTFEVESTVDGTSKYLVTTLYSGSIKVPVRFSGATTDPVIKNGYDYTVTVSFQGGNVQEATNYSAVLTESAEPRDISKDIESL